MSRSMSGRPTLKTVAAAAGVSTATVSYVLHGKDEGIPDSTAQRVLEAVRELGYRPNLAAQVMRTGRNNIAVLSLRMLSDPWAQAVAESAGRLAAARGMTALIQAEGSWIDSVSHVQPDVAFIDSPSGSEVDALRRMAAQGQRFVVFSETLEPDGFHVVRSLPRPGAQLVLDHLREQTDHIALLAASRAVVHAEDETSRLRPFLEAVASGEVRSRGVDEFDGTPAGAFRTAVRVLSEPDPPRAILAATDFAALAAISAAHFLGRTVPGDVLIAGLGDTEAGAASTPSLTSAGPADFYARQAHLILDTATEEVGAGRVIEYPWELRIRESTRS